MKPDWNDAPEWANWLAMDGNGEWFWYESEPDIIHTEWFNVPRTRFIRARTPDKLESRRSLESRPA